MACVGHVWFSQRRRQANGFPKLTTFARVKIGEGHIGGGSRSTLVVKARFGPSDTATNQAEGVVVREVEGLYVMLQRATNCWGKQPINTFVSMLANPSHAVLIHGRGETALGCSSVVGR